MWQNERFDYLEGPDYLEEDEYEYESDCEYIAYRPIKIDKPIAKDRKISVLINSNRFLLDSVYIMQEDDKYKLVVINDRRVIREKYYKTAKGCRSVFSMSYGNQPEQKITPQWSDFW